MLAAEKAALATIWLATIPPCLIARLFSSGFTKGNCPAGNPGIDEGTGAVEGTPGALATAGDPWSRTVGAVFSALAGQD